MGAEVMAAKVLKAALAKRKMMVVVMAPA